MSVSAAGEVARAGQKADEGEEMWSRQVVAELSLGTATYPTNNVLMVGEMRLARLAAVNLVAVQISVVCEPHG